jgi:hypothetical protein
MRMNTMKMKWTIEISSTWLQVSIVLLDPFFNSKEYYQKFSEMENSKLPQDPSYMYSFNPFFYDPSVFKDPKKKNK